jgi:hypothetical protein
MSCLADAKCSRLAGIRPGIESALPFICNRRREILRVLIDGVRADTHVVAR